MILERNPRTEPQTHTHEAIDCDWLNKWQHYSPNNIALQDGDTGLEISYKELYTRSCRGAEALKKKFNIANGDRVAVLAMNDLSYVVLFFALQRLGATLVPINYRLTSREVEHILTDCDPQLIVIDSEFKDLVTPARASKTALLHLCGSDQSFYKYCQTTSMGYTQFESTPLHVAMIIYTSGTTGAPKGAMITHKMLFWNSLNTTLRLNISQYDCAVIFLPFFHTGAWNVLTTPFLHRGAKTIFLKKFDAEKVLRLSEENKATLLFGVPTTMAMLEQHPHFEMADLSSIRYAIVGGEPMPLPLIERWHAKGLPVRQGYGLTEFGPNVFSLNEEDAIRKIGSIGFANFYIDTKIVNERGDELPPDQVGELLLRGPMCMAGYWNNAEATQSTLVNGWLHTGDLAYKDSDGYHYISGRKKDMYKSGGENVYPAEIEQVLQRHPNVKEAAVIGVPDEKWGESGKAFVCLHKPGTTADELSEYCVKNLAKFKIPKYFEFLETLPKGDSGKVLKRALI